MSNLAIKSEESTNVSGTSTGVFHDLKISSVVESYQTTTDHSARKVDFASVRTPSRTDAEESLAGVVFEPVFGSSTRADSMGTLESACLEKELKGVVSNVTTDCIFVNCSLPNDSIELSFPKSMVPSDLAIYGVPVYVSLEIVNGYKRPVVKHREVLENPHYQTEISGIDSWLEQL